MKNRIRPLQIVLVLGMMLAPPRAHAVPFAQLSCESRCYTAWKSCQTAQNHPGGNYYLCEDNYYDCKFGCTGAIDSFSSGIDPTASLLSGGRRLVVSGHVSCQSGATYRILSASALQDTAVAISTTPFVATCTGDAQTWELVLVARGSAAFDVGPVHVCASGDVYDSTTLLATRQWCIDGTVE